MYTRLTNVFIGYCVGYGALFVTLLFVNIFTSPTIHGHLTTVPGTLAWHLLMASLWAAIPLPVWVIGNLVWMLHVERLRRIHREKYGWWNC